MVSDFWGLVAYVLGFRIQGFGVSGFVGLGYLYYYDCCNAIATTTTKDRNQENGASSQVPNRHVPPKP